MSNQITCICQKRFPKKGQALGSGASQPIERRIQCIHCRHSSINRGHCKHEEAVILAEKELRQEDEPPQFTGGSSQSAKIFYGSNLPRCAVPFETDDVTTLRLLDAFSKKLDHRVREGKVDEGRSTNDKQCVRDFLSSDTNRTYQFFDHVLIGAGEKRTARQRVSDLIYFILWCMEQLLLK